jgi:hypothetical protein
LVKTRYYKRRWDEVRGDEHNDWGPSTWYFEVGDDEAAWSQGR